MYLGRQHDVEEKQQLSEAMRIERRQCKLCKLVFKDKKTQDEHMKVHTEGDLECEICKIPFTKHSLVYHEGRFHPELSAKKKLVSKNLSKKHDAEEKEKLAAMRLKNAKFCSICKIVCYDPKKFEDHMKVHTEGTFECEICKIPFTKKALVYHRRRFHENEEETIRNRTLLAIERCNATKRNTQEESPTSSENSAEINNIYKRLKAAAKSGTHCLICKYTFDNKKSLGRHMNVHIDGKYKCEICPIWFTKDTLMYHERRFHKQLRKDRLLKARETAISDENDPEESLEFQCDYCEIVSPTSAQKDEHMKVHTEGDLECEICKIPFTKRALSYHERRFHPEKIRKDRLLQAIERNANTSMDIISNVENSEASSKNQCVICKVICRDATALDKHISYHMGNYQCEVCQFFFTKNTLMYHLRSVHPEHPELLNKEPVPKLPEISDRNQSQSHLTTIRIKCEFCKITCSDKTRFDDHMRVHLEGDVECEICKIPFTKYALLYHEKRFHPKLRAEKRFSIAFARNSFRTIKQEEGSNESRENHDNDKENKHQCKICKLCCRDEKSFVSHMKVHTVGEFKCEVCQIWYTKPSLVDHLKRRHSNRIHELFAKALENFTTLKKNRTAQKSVKNKQTFRCDICKLCFGNRASIDKHAKVHTGEYECEICKIPFNMRALVIHLSRFHPDRKKELLSKAIENNDEISGHVDKNGHVVTTRNLKCEICKLIICGGKSKLDNHMKIHTEGDLECEVCKIPFTEKSLIVHQRNFHPDLPRIKNSGMNEIGRVTKQRYLKCQLCKIICKDKNRLDCHMMVHNGKFQCEICKVPFTMRALLFHLNRFHLDEKKELLAQALENNGSEESHQIRIDKNGHVKTQRLLKCEICKKLCGGRSILDKHMTVHTEGTLLCEICQITFTKNSLAYHEKHFHPELVKNKITALAEKKSKKIDQYDCNICDMSITGAKSIKQHIRSHTPNAKDSNEFPDASSNSSDYGEFSFICTEIASTSQVDKISNDIASQSFQCYICQKYFQKMSQLEAHSKKHIFYQQWIDPVNIHLSNWKPEKSREILFNQPLVLVDKLDIDKINVKSLGQFSEQFHMEIENQPEVNEFFIVNEVSTTVRIEDGNNDCDRNDTVDRNGEPAAVVNMNVEKNHQTNNHQAVKLEELPRRPVYTDVNVASCVIEIDSDSDVEAGDVPPAAKIRRKNNHYDQSDKNVNCNGLAPAAEVNVNSDKTLQTINNHNVNLEEVSSPVDTNINVKKEPVSRRSVYTDIEPSCVIDISSDSDSDVEASSIDVFHCYSCDTLCRTLEALSNHKRFCRMS